MDDDELEQKYQAFLAREQDKKFNTQIPEGKDFTKKPIDEVKLSEDNTQALNAVNIEKLNQQALRKSIKDTFEIDLEIEVGKVVAANKKVRYEFATKFLQKHWLQCVRAKIKLKDLLNV